MRILHVSEAHTEGVLTLLRHFSAEQVKAGHDVHVLGPEGMPALSGTRGHLWSLTRRQPSTYIRAAVELRRIVRDIRPDVVHLHSFLGGFFGRLPRVLSGGDHQCPVVYQPHAWAFDLREEAAVRKTIRTWERFAARRTDLLVANCTEEVEEGRSVGVDLPSRVLGVAVDLDSHIPVSREEQLRHRRELGINAMRVVVCVGRLVRQKGQDMLVAEWERHRPEDTALVLVGPGDQAPVRALAPTQWGRTVFAVGQQGDVRPWMWASDVLVLPSRYETVGLVVAEAMACGRPVVATDVNGVAETVSGPPLEPAGVVVPRGAMSELLGQVELRLEDPALWDAESGAARRRAEQLFGPSVVAGRLEDAYDASIFLCHSKVLLP